MTLALECFDRLYLNAYVPLLQTGAGAAWFFREVRVPSLALMAPMNRRFTESLERFARDRGVDVVTFGKGVRKDDVTQGYLRSRPDGEGITSHLGVCIRLRRPLNPMRYRLRSINLKVLLRSTLPTVFEGLTVSAPQPGEDPAGTPIEIDIAT